VQLTELRGLSPFLQRHAKNGAIPLRPQLQALYFMMTFDKFQAWIKGHRIFSFILIPLFLLGILFQLINAFDWFQSIFDPTEYEVIDIHFDPAEAEAESLYEGFGGGNSIFRVSLNKRGTTELIGMIANEPNATYLVNFRGTTPINGQWMEGGAFAIEFVGICDGEPKSAGYCESLILHFPSQDSLNGWSTFSEGVASCCENYFHLRGFYRFSFLREKMDRMNQYKAKNIVPNSIVAKRTIASLENGKYFQIYANKWKD
jgi:hypothetical protein